MTPQEKAEKYVREKCPELKPQKLAFDMGTRIPSIELQHWLRVLVPNHKYHVNGLGACFEQVSFNPEDRKNVWLEFRFKFDLTTGQPASEADYQAFNDIVGI